MTAATDQTNTKTCPACEKVLPLTEFTRNKQKRDGLERCCRHCNAKKLKERRDRDRDGHNAADRTRYKANPDARRASCQKWREKNREHTREYAREYARTLKLNDPEKVKEKERQRAINNPGRTSANAKKWQTENPEAVRANQRAWKKDNPDKVRAAARRYYHKYPEKHAAKVHGRRIRIANGGTFTQDDIKDIRKMQKDRCAVCRVRLHGKGTIDHIVALSCGGSNERRNLQLLCMPCNAKKSAKDPILFMRSLGRLL